MLRSVLLLTAGALSVCSPRPSLAAGAGPGGLDVLHVPLSWCAVQGSPAADAPNITGLNGTTDTTTDAVLWRRHERPTDNIWLPQASVSFRSAINDAWGTLNFPIIADPDTSFGTPGDVRGENLNVSSVEFDAAINACDAAWAALGRAGIGITAVNVNMFVTATGDYLTNATPGMEAATPIGWGGCVEALATGLCVDPLDARIAVADNNYLYPTVPDRSWRPSPLDPAPTFQYSATDSLDQLVGHELGHGLGLAHMAASTDLMFGTSTDNDGDADVDNISLIAAEVTQARNAALNTPGLEVDPPNQFVPGRYVRTRLPDAEGRPDADLLDGAQPHMELSAISGILDTASNTGIIDIQIGAMAEEGQAAPLQAWVGLDLPDIDPGPTGEVLQQLGFPEPDAFQGADFFIRADVRRGQVSGRGFTVRDGELVSLDGLRFQLLSLVMHPYYAQGLEGPDIPARLFDVVRVVMAPQVNVLELDREFGLQAFVVDGERIVDRLDTPHAFVLEVPSFPHCYPEETGVGPGATTPIRFEKLRPNEGVHGLIGPDEVVRGTADENGEGTLMFPVPTDIEAGPHLVTIGTDETALTADCTLNVAREEKPRAEPPTTDMLYSLIKSHERLLHDQQRLLAIFGELLRDLTAADSLPADTQAHLAKGYGALLARQTALIERFEEILKGMTGR